MLVGLTACSSAASAPESAPGSSGRAPPRSEPRLARDERPASKAASLAKGDDARAQPGVAEPAAPEPPRFRNPVVAREKTVARVLMYHSIGWHPPRPGPTPKSLRAQINWMRENGVEIVPMSTLLDFLDGDLALPERVAVVTIDDGERNGYTVAYPIFRELGVPFTLGIATDAIDRHESRGTMTWEQIRELVDTGLCEVASHSVTHRRMTALPDDAVRIELERSRELIEQRTGFRPEAFLYPLGAHDARVRKLTEAAGYRAGFVAWGAPVRATTRRFGLPRYAVEKGTGPYTFSRYFVHGL